jgi:uracil phosphoribosyltransferase
MDSVTSSHALYLRRLIGNIAGRTVLILDDWGIWDGELLVILEYLKAQGGFQGIRHLGLINTAVTDRVVTHQNLPAGLLELDVQLTHVTAHAIATLHGLRPRLIIRY